MLYYQIDTFFLVGSLAINSRFFNQVSGRRAMNNVRCSGDEVKLAQCPNSGNCNRYFSNPAVGVRCHIRTGYTYIVIKNVFT